uniref:Uncharacterized protein n=1 Tax=Brugia timori TaxID=42155 RepID=A0A0R3R1Q5_9BILA
MSSKNRLFTFLTISHQSVSNLADVSPKSLFSKNSSNKSQTDLKNRIKKHRKILKRFEDGTEGKFELRLESIFSIKLVLRLKLSGLKYTKNSFSFLDISFKLLYDSAMRDANAVNSGPR